MLAKNLIIYKSDQIISKIGKDPKLIATIYQFTETLKKKGVDLTTGEMPSMFQMAKLATDHQVKLMIDNTLKSILDQSPQPTSRSINSIEHLRSNVKNSKIKETLKSILDQSPQPTSQSINQVEHLRSNVKKSKIKEALKSILDQSPQPNFQSIKPIEHLRSNVNASANSTEIIPKTIINHIQVTDTSIKPVINAPSTVPDTITSTSAKKSMRIRRRIAATTNAKQKIKSSRKSKKSIGLFSKIKGFFGLSN
ncbi:1753_t:CDS:2 [Entrophospora sp. SA101]|nr:1753_t:CDS:2 [Entrophospora sp. SA101]